ncbi:BadF/BadG/BcrA/BcrD ATPase family protein [Sphingosinicella sp. BN140058]|uniref:BadF/BadG/BcrA/BcrD ATPase family protein n=1 Tax=Sphingosinicella sp. BN140058 TaxID=1892855 RepID=UPI00101216A3|nr:BadF/BadG/BcrA/BcrD ATPase family protein [Sphingosinicella sp. BN140058]QAY76192.1 ATPase [Sphingosinicella sp. BN140058]
MDYFLGIDAGGSHTRARLVTAGGEIVGTGEAGPANARIGLDLAIDAVQAAALQAMSEAGLDEGDLASIRAGLGIAGLNRRGVLPGLQEHHFPFRSIAFASDAAIANLGAHAGGDGAIVIVGTGSIGFARVGDDITTIGGYGFPVSDEGSGADLGLRAIRQSLWARDGRIPPSPMTDDVLAYFHGSAGEIVDWTARATATDYAAFAPMVMDRAGEGDAVAEPIVQAAARRLDRLIRVLLDRGAPSCCLMGGVAARMRDWLAASIRERLSEPLGDALDGAILLARTRAVEKEG